MKQRSWDLFRSYYRILIAFTITICLVRCYEYYAVANKSFVSNTLTYELLGLIYDVWACFVYSLVFALPFYLLSLINLKLAKTFFHILNTSLIVSYICLIIVFSERNNPFDHEFFTRKAFDTWTTTKQMMTSGFYIYVPFLLYIPLYFVLYSKWMRKINLSKKNLIVLGSLSVLSTMLIPFSTPNPNKFKSNGAYYLTSNKLSYWVEDSYHYFKNKDKFDAGKLNKAEVDAAIDFYQQNHDGFDFTSKEYPLLHKPTEEDVLGSFFNLDSIIPPNIVILVVEGLSRDFSGDKAYASSFTPFLDSLSNHSLTWDNFLSTAPATFASHPSIEGSLPYGRKGFASLNVMPDHLSLIKILKANGYHSKFLIGFNPDFDNMGGFIRLQGTDMILTKYGSKYKEMGIGEEGWSMGYPDDALFNRSFEVMDSLKQTPYLNIYHTGTTHMPYLFEQKATYDKLFDKKMKNINVSSDIKRTLKECKKVLVTYMFADDCFRDFFAKYSKRSDYKNTIFFITGDHHIGSFPSTGGVDDYHVPLIVYSPMLKQAKKFLSVNSHLNIAPTITSLILNNYKKLPYHPKEVHWMAGQMDTAAIFRNNQSMPFMYWSRDIADYIWKDYLLSDGQLYKLAPNLQAEKYHNDSIKQHMTNLLNNFKIVNSYVCDNNKIFPSNELTDIGEKKLLLDFNDPSQKTIFTKSSDTSLMKQFRLPREYKSLYIEVSADINLLTSGTEDQPSFRFALIDTTNGNSDYVFYTNHDIVDIAKGEFKEKQWNAVSTNDMFTMDDYKQYKNLVFDLAFYAQKPINLQMRNLRLRIYGVK
jgi:phosphoglycerol transferase MdoB-like AlkP superfamily enzyme